jgi:hypothetical protein
MGYLHRQHQGHVCKTGNKTNAHLWATLMMGINKDLCTGVFGNQEEVQHLSSRVSWPSCWTCKSVVGVGNRRSWKFIGQISRLYLDMRLDNREARWRQTNICLTIFCVNVFIVLVYPRLWIATEWSDCAVNGSKRGTICYVVLSFSNWE